MGCDDRSASSASACPCIVTTKLSHIRQLGKSSAQIECSIHVAKPSLSHRSSHHSIVTRLPNHWCASSWMTTSATRCSWREDALASSMSKSTSRYVTRPQFSIAPAANSGIATMSDLGSGYGTSKASSYRSSDCVAHRRANVPSSGLPGGTKTRMRTPCLVRAETRSNSPTTNASRYVDIRGVGMKLNVLVPSPWFRVCASGMFESAVMWLGTRSEHVKVALRRGSSKHGKQRRAETGSNWVDAISFLLPSMSTYVER
mmetsp:Transcript_94997/g.284755  ORF Transcript_94997/g.284755 Transcript_94997/m.284755 type:complete len:258 (+) Transcript_94997:1953-2726(+)